jgi:PKD repeat protein
MKLNKILAASLLMVIVSSVIVSSAVPVFASWPPPSHPHDANAVWIEPTALYFNTSTTTLPHLFNVTAYINVTDAISTYSVNVTVNPTQLKIIKAGYTHGVESDYFYPMTALSPGPSYGPSSVLIGESLYQYPTLENQTGVGDLFWVELNITATPPKNGKLTSEIDINNTDTWVQRPDFTLPTILKYSASYTFTSPKVLPPQPPVALFVYSPTVPLVNQIITFNGSASYDTDGTIVSWMWTFGDGGTASGEVVTHSYTSPGTYQVNLTVTDNNGLSGMKTEQITVYANLPAILYVTPPQIVDYTLRPPSIVTINITVNNVIEMYDYKFKLSYNNELLTCIGAIINRVQNQTHLSPIILINDPAGFIAINVTYYAPSVPITTSTPLNLVTVYFQLDTLGSSNLTLYQTELSNSNGLLISHLTGNGFIMTAIRDVAIVGVVPSSSWAYQGWTVDINVTAMNKGNLTESFNVTAFYGSNPIGTLPVTNLPPNNKTTLLFAWNTAGVLAGNYTIKGFASYVPYEYNKTNNVLVDGTVQIFTKIHDVAIVGVVPSSSWAYQGWTVDINVTAMNKGNFTESFNVTAFYGTNSIGTLPVTNLPPNNKTTLLFAWNTAGVPGGNYTIKGFASYVPYEYNKTNNVLVDGTVQILTKIHDVAIVAVVPYHTFNQKPTLTNWTYPGVPVGINVTAKNLGQMAESFDVSAYYNSSLVGTQHVVNLNVSQQITMVFTWNTTGLKPLTNYIIKGVASIVPYEFNTTNNVLVGGKVHIRIVGDLNGDDKVNMKDIAIIAAAFGTYGPNYFYPGSPASPRWDPRADITGSKPMVPDNKVNMLDVAMVASNFGK